MTRFWSRWLRQASQADLAKPTRSLAQYNTYDARNLLSHLLRRVRKGEEIVIAHAGDPIAKLVPYRKEVERRPGVFRISLIVNDGIEPENSAQPPTPTRSSPEAST
jgi:prevent-host-death family protein